MSARELTRVEVLGAREGGEPAVGGCGDLAWCELSAGQAAVAAIQAGRGQRLAARRCGPAVESGGPRGGSGSACWR